MLVGDRGRDDLQHHLRDRADGEGQPGPQFLTQLYAMGSGVIALAICLAIDYRKLAEDSLVIYGALIALLIFVLFRGSTQYNATRWIDVGPFNLQPSEFARMTIALMLAMFFGENRRGAQEPERSGHGGHRCRYPFPPDREAAGSRYGRDPDSRMLRHRVSGRAADAADRRCWRWSRC